MTRDESWSELQNTMPLRQVFSEEQMILVRHVHDVAFLRGREVELEFAEDMHRRTMDAINRHSDALAKAMVG